MASVSLEGLNLARMHHHHGGACITASATASSLASSSPPSGHSTPKLDPRSPAHDMERMGVMTLVSPAPADPLFGGTRVNNATSLCSLSDRPSSPISNIKDPYR